MIRLLVGGGLLLAAAVAIAAGWGEQALLQTMASASHPPLHFTETRHLSYLDVPLTTHGRLEFIPPAQLRRMQDGGDSFEITASSLVVLPVSGGRREVSLNTYPGLRAFADSFRAVLVGDVALLRRYYAIELHGGPDAWELYLRPTEQQIGRVIANVTLSGSGNRIHRVVTREVSGDYAVLELQEAQ